MKNKIIYYSFFAFYFPVIFLVNQLRKLPLTLREWKLTLLLACGVIWYILYTLFIPIAANALNLNTTTTYPKEVVAAARVEKAKASSALAQAELSMEDWVMLESIKRGLKPYKVWAIIQCESRWDPYAIGINNNGSKDLGLWQWNDIHDQITRECKFDYKCATNEAFNKRIHDGNWSAWMCANKLGI